MFVLKVVHHFKFEMNFKFEIYCARVLYIVCA